jgi:hypothetical protein
MIIAGKSRTRLRKRSLAMMHQIGIAREAPPWWKVGKLTAL